MNRRVARTEWAVKKSSATVLILSLFALMGCSSLNTTRSIPDIKSVAGRWDGNLTTQASEYGTKTGSATWIINDDGTFVMSTGKWRSRGKLSVKDGNLFFFDSPMASGFATLHEGPKGEKILLSTGEEPGTFGSWTAVK